MRVIGRGDGRMLRAGAVSLGLVMLLLSSCTERVVVIERQAATQASDDDREATAKRPTKQKKEAPPPAEPDLAVADVYDSFTMNRDIDAMVRCVFGERASAQTAAYYADLITREVQGALDSGVDIAAAHSAGKQAMLDDFLSNRAVRGALRDAERDRDMETIRHGSPLSDNPLDCIYDSLGSDI